MSNPYSQPSISGYNSSPPADDKSFVESNRVKWSTHIDKIGTPLKTFAEAIDSAALAAFAATFGAGAGTSAKSGAYTVATSDRGKTFVVTNAPTITLLAAAGAGDGFTVAVRNDNAPASGSLVTIDANASETINGALTLVLQPGDSALLVCNGSDWFALVGGHRAPGIEILANDTAATGATIDFESLISNKHAAILLVFDDLVPATDATDLYLRTSTDNGSTYSSASDYVWSRNSLASTPPSNTAAGDASDSEIELAVNLGSQADEQVSGLIWIINPAKGGQRPKVMWSIAYQTASDAMALATGAAEVSPVSAVNAFRLLMSSGNVSTINYTLYGFRAS